MVMENLEQTKKERTKRRIIKTAAPIFNKKGYNGTSLSDLTRATGLTKGSIYGNFANKEEVAVKTFEYNVDFITRLILKEIAEADNTVDKLLAYPRTYRTISKSLVQFGGCPIANTAVDSDDSNPALHQKVLEVIQKWRKSIVGLIERGKSHGEIKPEIDGDDIAALLLILIEGGAVLATATKDERFILKAVDRIEEMIESIRLN